MRIAKFIARAAIIAAPLSIASGQANTQPDSSRDHNTGKWIAGTAAVGGSALFLAFTQSANGADHNSFVPPTHETAPGNDTPAPPPATPPSMSQPPAGGTTPPPSTVPPDAAPPPPTNPPAPPADSTVAPTDTTSATSPTVTPPPAQDNPSAPAFDSPSGPSDDTAPASDTTDTPFVTDAPLPHEDAPGPMFENSSTVPEPGSLALTATGIIGLIPLIRRRRR